MHIHPETHLPEIHPCCPHAQLEASGRSVQSPHLASPGRNPRVREVSLEEAGLAIAQAGTQRGGRAEGKACAASTGMSEGGRGPERPAERDSLLPWKWEEPV